MKGPYVGRRRPHRGESIVGVPRLERVLGLRFGALCLHGRVLPDSLEAPEAPAGQTGDGGAPLQRATRNRLRPRRRDGKLCPWKASRRPTGFGPLGLASPPPGSCSSAAPRRCLRYGSSSTRGVTPQLAVGVRHETLVDQSRPTPADGTVPGHPGRVFETTVFYPALGGAGTAPLTDAPPTESRKPPTL